MTIVQKILLFFLLVLIFIIYLFWYKHENKKVIIIKPIKITPIVIEKPLASLKKDKSESPKNILSKLKIAVKASQSKVVIKPIENIEKKIVKKIIIKQKVQPKKIESKKIINKKLVQKKLVSQKIIKKIVLKESIKKNIKTSKTKVAQQTKKLIEKKQVSKEIIYKKTLTKPSNLPLVSETFEIEKELNSLPDSYYFEPIQMVDNTKDNAPLKFVKKLGVVAVSNKYESNFTVPQKTELAEEGIVEMSNASFETAEIKALEFVDTLGVVEVSPNFETIEANKYLN